MMLSKSEVGASLLAADARSLISRVSKLAAEAPSVDWVSLAMPSQRKHLTFEPSFYPFSSPRTWFNPLLISPADYVEANDEMYIDAKNQPRNTDKAGDKPLKHDETRSMNDITREEFNAKLESIEARMDARVESVSSKIDAFLAMQAAVQVERDKAQSERDRRFEDLAERAARAAEGAADAARQAATVKANYWAAVAVQLLAVVGILAGAYFANQANILGAMQTTMAAFQAGKAEITTPPPAPPSPSK